MNVLFAFISILVFILLIVSVFILIDYNWSKMTNEELEDFLRQNELDDLK
jgi:hypothetical protein